MKKLFLVLLTSVCSMTTYSQLVKPPVDVKSPTAASLGIYGDIPVGHYNGSTNIEIPLYQMEEKGFPLSVSLSYNSTGVRINSVASWVGQNWSLNAGGIITREIRHKKDFLYHIDSILPNHGGPILTKKGFKHAGNRLTGASWFNQNNLAALADEAFEKDFGQQNQYYNMDLEPDIFTFSFFGMSGKFFLDNDGEWKVQSNAKLKIETTERIAPNLINDQYDGTFNEPSQAQRNDIGKIIITDENGFRYVFGETNDHIEYSAVWKPNLIPLETPNSWYLSKVIDNNNHELYSFEYQRLEDIYHSYRTRYYMKAECDDAYYLNEYLAYSVVHNATSDSSSGSDVWKQFGVQIISPVYLTKITSKSGNTVEFEISNLSVKPFSDIFTLSQNEWKQLDYIKVKDYHGKLIKSLNLEYFPLSSMTDTNRRLNLKSVKDLSDNNNHLTLYSFEYDRFDELPDYTSKKFDKWGYFNGQDFVIPEVPSEYLSPYNMSFPPSNFFNAHDISRASNDTYSLVGLLTKIIYPTKGYTRFEYEGHRATKKVNNNKQLVNFNSNTHIGGARIKRIEKHALSSPVEVITYEYDGGILMHDFTSFNPNWNGGNSEGAAYVFNINSLVPLSNINGGHIHYSTVIERYSDNSSTLYKYSDYNIFPDVAYEGTLNSEQSIFNRSTDRSLLRGKLLEVQKRDSFNTIQEKTEFEYLNIYGFPHNNKYVKAFEYRMSTLCNEGGLTYGNAYRMYYMDHPIVRETTTTYYDYNREVSTNTYFEYNEDFLVSEKRELNSLGELNKTKFRYPKDFAYEQTQIVVNTDGTTSEIINRNVYSDMVLRHIINEPIEVVSYLDDDVLSSEINSFYKYSGNIKKSKLSTLEDKSNLPSNFSGATVNGLNDLTLDSKVAERIIFDRYDDHGNIEMYHGKNGFNTIVIWGYKKKHVIAKIKNVNSYNDVSGYIQNLQSLSDQDNDRTIGFSGNEGALRNALNNLRSMPALSSSLISTFTYDPLVGMTSATGPDGKTIYYNYDENNRLSTVKDFEGNILTSTQYNYKN